MFLYLCRTISTTKILNVLNSLLFLLHLAYSYIIMTNYILQ